ncbi:MAG: hypothetical protein J5803_03055, partial [Desulfovibrio sp.]|nr:hypothetical protein [Desulfovibrio sp.]
MVQAQDRIKLKDLATEMNVQFVEVQNVVRDNLKLTLTGKSQGISLAEAEKVRQILQEQKDTAEGERKKPDVIVRRRRKEASSAEESDVAVKKEEAKPKGQKEEEVQQKIDEASVEPKETEKQPSSEPSKGEDLSFQEPKARIIAPPAQGHTARVIRLPGQNTVPAKDAAPEEQPPSSATVLPDAKQDATRLAAVSGEEEGKESIVQKSDVEKPLKKEFSYDQSQSSEQGEQKETDKTAKLVRRSSADASAEPEGSSAPTLPEQKPTPKKEKEEPESQLSDEDNDDDDLTEEPVTPKVRIISRPTQPARAQDGRDGKNRDRGERGNRSGNGGGRKEQGRGTNRQGAGFRNQQAVPMPDMQEQQSKKKRM